MRALLLSFVLLNAWTLPAMAQDAAPDANSATAPCTFADGSEISTRYSTSATQEELRNGKPWQPGSSAMLLFTTTPLVVNHVNLPPGAYRLYVIPDKKTWTFVVSKNITPGSEYDQTQDLVREPMEIAPLPSPLKLPDIGFAHVAPKQCNLRVYFGKIGAWAEISQQ